MSDTSDPLGPSDPLETVTEFLRLIGSVSTEANTTRAQRSIWSVLSPDVEIVHPDSLSYGGIHRGHSGFKVLARTVQKSLRLTLDEHNLFRVGPYVIMKGILRATAVSGGDPVTMPIVEFYSVLSGQIERIEVFYRDPSLLPTQTGYQGG